MTLMGTDNWVVPLFGTGLIPRRLRRSQFSILNLKYPAAAKRLATARSRACPGDHLFLELPGAYAWDQQEVFVVGD